MNRGGGDGDSVENTNGEPREMITPMLREALEKQGYKLIGSHSGVKLCRWTKVHNSCLLFSSQYA